MPSPCANPVDATARTTTIQPECLVHLYSEDAAYYADRDHNVWFRELGEENLEPAGTAERLLNAAGSQYTLLELFREIMASRAA